MSRNAFRVPKDIGEEQEEIKHGRRAVVAFHPFTPTGTTHCHFLSVYLREKRWKGGVESDRKGIYIDANKYSNHSRVQVGKKGSTVEEEKNLFRRGKWKKKTDCFRI